jgi:hypothetical protein
MRALRSLICHGMRRVPRLRRSDHVGIDTQPFRAGLKFGYRPYGPGSDSRSIFEFPHRLCRAGLKFSGRPSGPWRFEGSAVS